MKAFAIDAYKGALTSRQVPDTVAGPSEVLVAIGAASINPLDVKLRDGAFKLVPPYRMPLILGHDLAGTVIALGPGTRRFKIGDEVFARPDKGRIGSLAERIAVAEADLALKPTRLGMVEAAALPLVSLTAWQVLVERAQLRSGQRVLIHAGSGGVGKLISISGPPDPAFARQIGAGCLLRQLLRLASFGIRAKAQQRGIDYSFLFMRADGGQLAEIAKKVDAGVIQPVIDRMYAFDETPAALERVASGRVRGKVVIGVAQDPAARNPKH